ncbi:MAG: hypothetical protein NTZ14_13695 [Hyphomicrobiales bacterium]|nr:hypothetical protein [Hyphomicrobiales bacterium]
MQDFLEQGPHAAALKTLDRFMTGVRFRPEPKELVFREQPSSLFDASGVRITSF